MSRLTDTGEIQEIRLALSNKDEKKRILGTVQCLDSLTKLGMQELLELMTSGKNADSLFDDVLSCLASVITRTSETLWN